MEKRLIVIMADDLTGASDSGVQFSKKGLKTVVLMEEDSIQSHMNSTDVLVIDTDTRSVSKEESYKKIQKILKSLPKNTFLYKKIDSTFRGNIAVEIDAILDQSKLGHAFIIPAFPRIGRTTSKGIHYLHNIPIAETEIGRDPKTPVKDSELRTI